MKEYEDIIEEYEDIIEGPYYVAYRCPHCKKDLIHDLRLHAKVLKKKAKK